jgi:prepilin-type N-terminal cleavage/methylation domain-containing protein
MNVARYNQTRRSRAGVTLIELLVVVVLMLILSIAVGRAFIAGLDLERNQAQRRSQQQRSDSLEQNITRVLQGAVITDNVDDTTTFFIGEDTSGGTGDEQLGCDRLTFTSIAPSVSLAAQESTDDFETQQTTLGPVGGVAEIALGTTPFGDAGARTGLFERLQRPSDGDPTQGGREWRIDPQIDRLGFQFYDGTQWVNTWDTVTGGERRLPAAVRVSYTLKGAPEDSIRSFMVLLPASDVDSQSPAVMGGNTP